MVFLYTLVSRVRGVAIPTVRIRRMVMTATPSSGYDHLDSAGKGRHRAPAPDYALAKKILGPDFVTPEEIMAKRKVAYTAKQIATLASQLPSEDDLRWLKENDSALMAMPPSDMSLLDVCSLRADDLFSDPDEWHADKDDTFAREDKTSFGWFMPRKSPVAHSTQKMWREQVILLSDIEYVPNAAETSWFVTTYYEVRGIRLFEDVNVRTSSMDLADFRVSIGLFDSAGLYIGILWNGNRASSLGLASALMF